MSNRFLNCRGSISSTLCSSSTYQAKAIKTLEEEEEDDEIDSDPEGEDKSQSSEEE